MTGAPPLRASLRTPWGEPPRNPSHWPSGEKNGVLPTGTKHLRFQRRGDRRKSFGWFCVPTMATLNATLVPSGEIPTRPCNSPRRHASRGAGWECASDVDVWRCCHRLIANVPVAAAPTAAPANAPIAARRVTPVVWTRRSQDRPACPPTRCARRRCRADGFWDPSAGSGATRRQRPPESRRVAPPTPARAEDRGEHFRHRSPRNACLPASIS